MQPSGKDTATINTNVPLGEGVAENAASAAVAARGAQVSAKFFTSVDSACACSFENETAFMRTSSPPGSVKISSKTGVGMAELYAQITKILTSGTTTEREQAGLGSARQKEAVAEALECTKHALVSADDNYTLDAVVQDLEDTLDALGEVTGDVTPDDVLGSIFANFCVGK